MSDLERTRNAWFNIALFVFVTNTSYYYALKYLINTQCIPKLGQQIKKVDLFLNRIFHLILLLKTYNKIMLGIDKKMKKLRVEDLGTSWISIYFWCSPNLNLKLFFKKVFYFKYNLFPVFSMLFFIVYFFFYLIWYSIEM